MNYFKRCATKNSRYMPNINASLEFYQFSLCQLFLFYMSFCFWFNLPYDNLFTLLSAHFQAHNLEQALYQSKNRLLHT